MDSATYKLGMRRLATGVSIVTTTERGRPYGLVATSVSSVSADPLPSLLVCVNQNADAHDHIMRAGHFCVNVLGQDDHLMAGRFASADRERRFESPRWTELRTGSPALGTALASFDCSLSKAVPIHSHTIFIGEVLDLRLWREDIAPLLYVNGHFDSLAAA